MEHYFNNQSLPYDAQIYCKKLTVLSAVTKTIFYRFRLRSFVNDHISRITTQFNTSIAPSAVVRIIFFTTIWA